MSNHHSLSSRRSVPINLIAVGAVLILALVVVVSNMFGVGAALAQRGPGEPPSCPTPSASQPTPQATSESPSEPTAEASVSQPSQGMLQFAVATVSTTATTTIDPGRHGRPRPPCSPDGQGGPDRTTTGTPLATPGRPERPTADPNATPSRPERPTAEPNATPGTGPGHNDPGMPPPPGQRRPPRPQQTAQPAGTASTAPGRSGGSNPGSGYPSP